jgi:hypothetical protein
VPVAAPSQTLEALSAPPVFVVGHPRSGTTWTFELLEAHPEVAGVFESWLFHDRLGLSGLFDPAAWDPEIAERNLREIGRPVGIGQLLERREMTLELRGLAERWLMRAVGPGERYLVEKTPAHVFFAPLIAEVLPQARFVEVVRDGRDAALSVLSATRGWNPRLVRGTTTPGIEDVAREWAQSIEAGRRNEQLLGDRWVRVRFEDLKADFDATMSGLFAFCEMPCDEALLERVRVATDLAGHAGGEGRFRRSGRVGDWRAGFSRRDAQSFDRVAGVALVDSGYAPDRNWWRTAQRGNRLLRSRP